MHESEMQTKQEIMEASGGVNLAQNSAVRVVDSDETGTQRELPPPYSEHPPRTIIRETIIVQPPLKDGPMFYPCPRCLKRVLTKVEYVNTRRTHMLAGFIFGLTCWCLLCCLAATPYLIPTFKKVEHYCPDCNICLGEYCRV